MLIAGQVVVVEASELRFVADSAVLAAVVVTMIVHRFGFLQKWRLARFVLAVEAQLILGFLSKHLKRRLDVLGQGKQLGQLHILRPEDRNHPKGLASRIRSKFQHDRHVRTWVQGSCIDKLG